MMPDARFSQEPDEIRISVGLEQKVNLGNYESVGVSVFLSGVYVGTPEAEIERALDTAKITYDSIRGRLRDKVRELREGGNGR